jgi:hypothetical protein
MSRSEDSNLEIRHCSRPIIANIACELKSRWVPAAYVEELRERYFCEQTAKCRRMADMVLDRRDRRISEDR